jgi:phytoene desaturase
VEGMEQVAREQGVEIITDCPVHEIVVEKGVATKVVTARGDFTADVVVAGADYHHVEQELMEPRWRSYGPGYWKKRTMAPSSLLFYLGINKRLKNLQHHNLFFDKDFGRHAREIYEQPAWPSDPLFYACVPSQTDASVAPQGSENLFLLVPVAPGLEDSEEIREHYYGHIMDRLEALSGQSVRDAVVYKRSYAHRDFVQDYNAFRGNAYGLANTLRQTALLKPALKSKRVKNLYYTGQLTVPGPGVPPSLISGQVVASEIEKDFAS